ncbi:DUF1569 domain-containing protein [Xanthovirga aplysinae]|uniref:DUF1569 domain-containing protein n=1 Tax=Xanthovirga aplysinae TaxID=2529853 RepID=UPI0012BD5652|nr:DUF1569 domain-containing protein [Xanthovirga aplysinae]MTI32824.1 DUF1569 domain-containing protein [Xanthovirga aplysinae]
MDYSTEEFLKNLKFDRLKVLTPESSPVWGIMTAQHMIEHLTHTLQLSNGKKTFPLKSPKEKLPALMAFLLSDNDFPKGFKSPVLGSKLAVLHHKDLQSAIHSLKTELKDFIGYYKQNPDAKNMHPVFGLLNGKEWIIFHQKHFKHHLSQFDLIPEKERQENP